MSKDEKNGEPEIKVNDRRRFKSSGEGNDVEKNEHVESKPEAPAETAQEEQESCCGCGHDHDHGHDHDQDCDCGELPPITFNTLIFSLSTQAMINLGEFPDPMSRETKKNIPLAKQTIDLLGILEEKTKGNLDEDEAHFIKQSLMDLRLRFVECCKEK